MRSGERRGTAPATGSVITDRQRSPARGAWRTPVALVLLLGVGVLWLLMISSSADGFFLEPTSNALVRAAAARGPTIGYALGGLAAVVGLAVTAARPILLVLAAPAVTTVLVQTLLPDAAGVIIALGVTVLAGASCGGYLVVERLRPPGGPVMIRIAAVLAMTYATVLILSAALLVFEQLTGRGHVGALDLSGLALRGFVITVAALVGVALLLGTGSTRLPGSGAARLISVPLLLLLVLGTVGEIVDVAGGRTSVRSNLVGLAVLGLLALPVVLLRVRRGLR